MKKVLGLSLALSALLLIHLSCGGGSCATGKWTIDTAAMKKAILEESTAGMSEDKKKEMANNPMIKGMLDMFDEMKMEMDLKADGTCSSLATVNKETDSTTGTWKMEGEILTITMMGMMEENPVEETQKFKVKGDTLEMILDEEQKKAGRPAFVFIRE